MTDAALSWLLPLVVALLAGVLCAQLGTLLVVQQRVLSTQVMAYGVLPGLVMAEALALPPLLGGLAAALLSLLLAEALAQRRVPRDRDASLTVVLAASLSLGVLLLHGLQQDADLESLLFGDLLLSGGGELVTLTIGALLWLLLLKSRFQQLLWLSVDPRAAADAGLSLVSSQRLLTLLTAWILVTAAQALGVALVMALVCAPAALVLPRAQSLTQALRQAGLAAATLSVGGFLLAITLDWPPSPAIALISLLTLVVQGWTRAASGSPQDGSGPRQG